MESDLTGTHDPLGRLSRDATVRVRQHSTKHGVTSWWEPETRLGVEVVNYSSFRMVEISGNRAGLISLARDLLTLAQNEVPSQSTITHDAETLDGDSETVMLTLYDPWRDTQEPRSEDRQPRGA